MKETVDGLKIGIFLSIFAIWFTFWLSPSQNPTLDTVEYIESRYLGK